ncbi:Dynein heavy chain 10, axonemal [Homalodisca vitripennis]|nr:Dynein heavy chain 10, axonemal [Homalodisca vitripennis]
MVLQACSVIELYGVLDPDTRDWTDGLLSNIFRELNKPTDKAERRYILFDGDVDALWIENMNSVMDDNKLLTLANGERIRLLAHCALLFEVGDLRYASPATVSRAGMVYVDPKNLGYDPYWQRWLTQLTRPEEDKESLAKYWETYIPPALDLILEGLMGMQQGAPLRTIIPQTGLNMVTQLCFMLDALLGEELEPINTDELECVFILSLYGSLGAAIVADDRKEFDNLIKKTAGFMTVEDSDTKMAGYRYLPIREPTLYEYFLDRKQKVWIPWKLLVQPYVHDPEKKFSDILVPTEDSTKITWLLTLMNEVRINIF